jgi:hypothetical protein
VVVIHALGAVVEGAAAARGWPVRRVAEGRRHLVYALGPVAEAPDESDDGYRHDTIQVGALELERPADLSEDPAHLREGLPLLLECLPRKLPGAALAWRVGAGAVPVSLAARGVETIAADRDLLALAFAERNAKARGLTIARRGAFWLPAALRTEDQVGLIVGELAPGLGEAALRAEVASAAGALTRGGEALWLAHRNTAAAVFERTAAVAATKLAARGSYAVWRTSAAKT